MGDLKDKAIGSTRFVFEYGYFSSIRESQAGLRPEESMAAPESQKGQSPEKRSAKAR